MRYAITVDVDVPRDELVTLVDDPMELFRWHAGLVRVEPLDGQAGLEGSSMRLVYTSGGRCLEVVETIVAAHLPEYRTSMMSAPGSCAETRHEFEALGEYTTRWTQHVNYAFTGRGLATFGVVMPGALARRTRAQMAALKAHAEAVRRVAPADRLGWPC